MAQKEEALPLLGALGAESQKSKVKLRCLLLTFNFRISTSHVISNIRSSATRAQRFVSGSTLTRLTT